MSNGEQVTNVSGNTQQGGTATDLERYTKELGLLGGLFGSKEHAPINVAGLVILVCLIGILVTPFTSDTIALDLVRTLGGIALAALTFLGGYLGGKSGSGG